MLPILAIIGRPNVGKSTLFNCLTKSRAALVADFPGVTRDRLYGECHFENYPCVVVDTGGIAYEKSGIAALMTEQTQQAIRDADGVIFVVDARSGLTASDRTIAQCLRENNKPTILAVNKTESLDVPVVLSDFYSLGLGEPQPISAAHDKGTESLLEHIFQKLPQKIEAAEALKTQNGIKIAFVGRPNVGKSTLINRLLGEERVVVYDQPGTTRDSIYIPYTRRDKNYVLIDTAGIRRRRSIQETIEKFSVIKTLQAIESAHVVILVVDAREGIADQDLHLLGFILQAGKALVIAVNKWDGLTPDQREAVRKELDRRLVFVNFAEIKFISALHGTGVGELYPLIEVAYASAMRELNTSELTRILEGAVAAHQPPLVGGRHIKLRYAHAGGHNPPVIVIHGKQTKFLPESYRRYLSGVYRKALNLIGTPICIEFRDS